jgi:hypothetical protein
LNLRLIPHQKKTDDRKAYADNPLPTGRFSEENDSGNRHDRSAARKDRRY